MAHGTERNTGLFLSFPDEVQESRSISPGRRFKFFPATPAHRSYEMLVSSRCSVTSENEESESSTRGWRSDGDYEDDAGSPTNLRRDLDDYKSLDASQVLDFPSYSMGTLAHDESPTPLGHSPPREGRFTTKLVTFYRNGDKHFKGLTLPVNQRNFRLWDTLLRYLAEKINLPYGVRCVYNLAGEQVVGISELMDGGAYVCASGHFAKNVSYGRTRHAERPWQNRSHGHGVRGSDMELYQIEPSRRRAKPTNHSQREKKALANSFPANPVHAKPRMVHIVSNTHRASKASILLNPKTTQSFEQVLHDMTPAIIMRNPPVKQLYTWRTEEAVLSFTQLFRDFKKHNKFIVCGAEPLQRTTIDAVSDSSTESDSPDGRGRYKGHGGGDHGVYRETDGQSFTWLRQRIGKKMNEKKTGVSSSLDVYSADESTSPLSSTEDNLRMLPENPRKAFVSRDRSYSPRQLPEHSRKPHPNAIHQDEVPVGIEEVHRRFGNYRYSKPVLENTNNGERHDQIRVKAAVNLNGGTDDSSVPDGSIPGDREQESRKALTAPIKMKIRGKTRQFLPPSAAVGTRTNNRVGLAPKNRLKLQWVYGYRGIDHGNNLSVLSTGELLYYVGAVAVLYDKVANTQRHYTGHNEDIRSIAVHPNGTHVATGQIAGRLPESAAHIRVWEVEQLHTHAILGLDFFTAGIACLSFSHKNRGEWLMAIEQGPKHVLSVWDWNNDKLLAKSKENSDDATHTVETDAVVLGAFNPRDSNTIVGAAGRQLLVWRLVHQNIVRDKKSGNFDNQRPAYITCLVFAHTGDVLTGDSSGNVIIWKKDRESVFRPRHCIYQAHHQSVFALCLLEDGTLLSGGRLDQRLRAWNSLCGYTPANSGRVLPGSAGGIRTIVPADPSDPDSRIILGTTRNQIMEGSLHTEFVYVLQGHCQGLYTVVSHPTERVFATAGYDQRVMMWRAVSHQLIWSSDVQRPCTSCTFNPAASVLVVGTADGRFTVLNPSDGMHIASVQVGTQPLNAMHFSPDGGLLALGSQDHHIYMYLVLDDAHVYRKAGILRGHSSLVRQMDWSLDGSYLQSVSGDCDLLFCKLIPHKATAHCPDPPATQQNSLRLAIARGVAQMKRIKQDATKDVVWKTYTCTVGYSVYGIWSAREKDMEVTSVDRSQRGSLLAAGDRLGWLSLYRYPCTSTKATSYDVKSQSCQIATVRFLSDDCYVISAGGVDSALMQWAVVGKRPKANNGRE